MRKKTITFLMTLVMFIMLCIPQKSVLAAEKSRTIQMFNSNTSTETNLITPKATESQEIDLSDSDELVYGNSPSEEELGNNSTITIATTTFDKNIENQTDLIVKIELNGNKLEAIKYDSYILKESNDYTVSSDIVTINNSYLSSLSTGKAKLIFDFNAGIDPSLTLTIIDSNILGYDGLKVQMFNNDTSPATNSISPKFKIINTSSEAIDLNNITIRYYYTSDGADAQNFWCDHAVMVADYIYTAVTSYVTGSFVDAEDYVELGFENGAGTLPAGGYVEVQARFAKSDWINYDQSDDYSFNSSSTQYVDWEKVTAYISGVLVYGTPPTEEPPENNSSISPVTAIFDKETENQADITVTMTLNGNTLTAIKNGTYILVEGNDYTVSDNIVTILKNYLATLSVGTVSLTFDFSAGDAQVLTINVVNTHEEGFNVKIGTASCASGDTITIPVSFVGVPSNGILTCDFKLNYDPNIFESVSILAGDIIKSSTVNFSSSVNIKSGTISYLFLDNTLGSELITTDGVFANIVLKVVSGVSAQTAEISLKSIGAFVDADMNTITANFTNGNIEIE